MPHGPQVVPWPGTAFRASHGAVLHPGLATDPADLIIRKGFRSAIDSSAASKNDRTTPTGLEGYLRSRGVS